MHDLRHVSAQQVPVEHACPLKYVFIKQEGLHEKGFDGGMPGDVARRMRDHGG
jgi:hypothetical protein